jgi:hypothetical protein
LIYNRPMSVELRKLFGLAAIVLAIVVLASLVLGGCFGGTHPKELIAEVWRHGNDTFVAYRLERDISDSDIRLQKLDGDGNVLWDAVLFSGDNSRASGTRMVGGDDGVLVAWDVYLPEDGPEGPYSFDHVTLASVDGEGAVRWQQDFAEKGIVMVTDGGGGVIMAWTEGEAFYARGVDSRGDVLWEQALGGGGGGLTMAVGGEGEALILWNDYDNRVFRLHKVGVGGELLWSEEGVAIEYAETAVQPEPQILNDGLGGAMVVWVEDSNGQLPYYLWLQKIGDEGQDLGRFVLCELMAPMGPLTRVVPDEPMDLGIIVVWKDLRDGTGLYAMRDSPLRSFLWTPNGMPVCTGMTQISPFFDAVSDGDGGVVVAWMDGDRRLYLQRLDYFGDRVWGENDEGVLVADDVASWPIWLVGDEDNGFVVGWLSGFDANHPDDSYIQKIDIRGDILWEDGGVQIGP